MTDIEHREQIIKDYDVDPATGRIRRPGKFEGEMLYVPFYWNAVLEGLADYDVNGVAGFRLDAHDKETWPELKHRRALRLKETDQGFVIEVK